MTAAERFSALTEEERREIWKRWKKLPLADSGNLADGCGVSGGTIHKVISDVS